MPDTPMTERDAFGVLRRLTRDALVFRGRLAVALASVAGLALSQLALTWLIKLWVEGPLVTGDPVRLKELLQAAIAAMSVAVLSLFGTRYVVTDMSQRFVESLRNRAMKRVLAMRVSAVRSIPAGDLLSRVLQDTGALDSFLPTVLRRLVGESILVVGAVILMWVLDWRIALATFAVVPLTGLLLVRAGAAIRRWGSIARTELGSLTATFSEQLQGVTTIKVFQTETREAERFALTNASLRRKALRAEIWSALLICGVFILTGTALLAILWRGTAHFASGAISQASLLAFGIYGAQIVEPLRRLSEIHSLLQQAVAAAARVYGVIDECDVESANEAPVAAATRSPRIVLENVGFEYVPGHPVLRDFSLTIEPGEQIAIVGSSGSGKSTLARLLVRFLDPVEGAIAFDGTTLAETDLARLRRDVCILEQETFLFRGTLLDNVAYGCDAATVDDALAALSRVSLAPRAADAPLVEAGRDLSGGERQRIALARAMLRNSPVVILDEATSAIDADLECGILDAMADWMSRRTVVCLAHRLSTIARFPRIVVLDGGRIAGDGCIGDLVETCDAFRELFAEQFVVGSIPEGVVPSRSLGLAVTQRRK